MVGSSLSPPAAEPWFLAGGWDAHLRRLVERAERQLTVVAPFVTAAGADRLRDVLGSRAGKIEIRVVTNLSAENVAAGATDPAAVIGLGFPADGRSRRRAGRAPVRPAREDLSRRRRRGGRDFRQPDRHRPVP